MKVKMEKENLEQVKKSLKKYWGFDSLRDGQDKAVLSILKNKDTLVLFPTGGGKSLCYQLPAVVSEGMALVISPLVALMQDQVEQLRALGIRATFINSTIPYHEVEQRLVNARNGMYKLLYLSPERLSTSLWKAELPNLEISLIAVDEAHCISQWGHEFRPAYREIRSELHEIAHSVPWVALTATATPEVKSDIIESLQLKEPEVIAKGFGRPNLKWWVTAAAQKSKLLLKAVVDASRFGSGIVYAGTRYECNSIADHLSSTGLKAMAYHAGMDTHSRNDVQDKWLNNKVRVVVATNAFGMGIDKPDCRFVIHQRPPYSIEAYYQEAGRAGRDGETAYPVILFKKTDFDQAKKKILSSYPDLEELNLIYRTVCDELNLAVGREQEEEEPLNLQAVSIRSQKPEKFIQSALNVLERLKIIELRKNRSAKVGIRFILNQDLVRQFINDSSEAKSKFTDKLYRLYGPQAFTGYEYVELSYLLDKLNVNENTMQKALRILSEYDQVLTFHRTDNDPLVRVLQSRTKSLNLSRKEVEFYRDILIKKLDYVKLYCETNSCREVFLRRYFGETDVRPCGHCDNCIRNRSDKNLTGFELKDNDIKFLKNLLEERPKTLREIKHESGWSISYTKKITSFLVNENQIEKNSDPEPLYFCRAESAS